MHPEVQLNALLRSSFGFFDPSPAVFHLWHTQGNIRARWQFDTNPEYLSLFSFCSEMSTSFTAAMADTTTGPQTQLADTAVA